MTALVNALVNHQALWLLAGGMVAVYIASRAAVDALVEASAPRKASAPAPGRRALGHWIPIAVVALFAAATEHSALALGVLFATSVAALALVGGLVGVMTPHVLPDTPTTATRVAGQRSWLFLLPASLLTFMAGFAGHLTWFHAVTLGLEGLVIWSIWKDPAGETVPPAAGDREIETPARPRRPGMAGLELLLAIGLAAVGAWALVQGTVAGVRGVPHATEGLFAAAVLGPILILPMVGPCVLLGHRGRMSAATGTQVGLALLNLCLLLPLVVGVWSAAPVVREWFAAPTAVAGTSRPTTRGSAATASDAPSHAGATTDPATDSSPAATHPAPEDFSAAAALSGPAAAAAALDRPLNFPLGLWRIDNVLLIVLGFMLLPVGLGRWRIGRGASIALLAGYALYILLNALAAVGLA